MIIHYGIYEVDIKARGYESKTEFNDKDLWSFMSSIYCAMSIASENSKEEYPYLSKIWEETRLERLHKAVTLNEEIKAKGESK